MGLGLGVLLGSRRAAGGVVVSRGNGRALRPRCPWIIDKKRASPGGAKDTLARFCRPSRPVLLFSNVPGATRFALAPGYHLPRLRRFGTPAHLPRLRRFGTPAHLPRLRRFGTPARLPRLRRFGTLAHLPRLRRFGTLRAPPTRSASRPR
jgi:hypothetical protein